MASATAFPVDDGGAWDVSNTIKKSAPIDMGSSYDTTSLAGKMILITGGASGFGAAFARKWAGLGAHIMIGDIDDAGGSALAGELRALAGSSGHQHFQHCDVTRWEDLVALFKAAAAVSPTGGIDAVVAAAGIIETNPPLEGRTFDMPGDLAADSPPPPRLKVLAVNLTGVSYTAHLALFWLPRNGPPKKEEEEDGPTEGGDKKSTRAQGPEPVRDRHLLLISSIAGLAPLPGQTEYTVSKHAVMGLFRAMRGNAFRRGIRCNIICPYFVNTPLLPPIALGLLAGGGMAEMEDVVDAATRLVADESIVGRGLVVGPKMYVVDGDEHFEGDSPVVLGAARATAAEDKQAVEARQNEQRATWEIYAHDYEKVEVFVWRYIAMVNRIKAIRGFIGTIKDLYRLFISRREKKK